MNYRWHAFYLAIIAVLVAALLLQGGRLQRLALGTEAVVAAQDLYQDIRRSPGKYQIMDLREAAEFEDGHLPQAINLKPGPIPRDAPVDRYRRTVIVSEEGDSELYQALAREFRRAANLQGGMLAWRMSRLPEVSGLTDTAGLRRGRPG